MDPKSTAVVLIEYQADAGSSSYAVTNNIKHLSRYFH